jgi:hypothetical protein
MPALVAGIHVFRTFANLKTWMAGTSPAMTAQESGRPSLIPEQAGIQLFSKL